MTNRRADIYVDEVLTGVLKETEEGYEFAYGSGYLERDRAIPVSLTLPLRKEPCL